MKNEVGYLNLHQKVPIWTKFEPYFTISLKIEFPHNWICKCPFYWTNQCSKSFCHWRCQHEQDYAFHEGMGDYNSNFSWIRKFGEESFAIIKIWIKNVIIAGRSYMNLNYEMFWCRYWVIYNTTFWFHLNFLAINNHFKNGAIKYSPCI